MAELISAVSGSFTSVLFGTPFVRVQTLLQTQDMISGLNTNPMKGLFNGINRIRKEEGIFNLWRSGFPFFIVFFLRDIAKYPLNIISNAVLLETREDNSNSKDDFANFEATKVVENNILEGKNRTGNADTLKGILEKDEPVLKKDLKYHIYNSFIITGFMLSWSLITHPLETLRVRMACDYGLKSERKFTGLFNATKNLYKYEGVKAFYRGYIPLTITTILQQVFCGPFMNREKPLLSSALWFVNDLVLFPLVVVSHRMIMQSGNELMSKDNGMRDCLKRTYKEFGIRSLYRGFQVTLFFHCLMGGIGALGSIDSFVKGL